MNEEAIVNRLSLTLLKVCQNPAKHPNGCKLIHSDKTLTVSRKRRFTVRLIGQFSRSCEIGVDDIYVMWVFCKHV